MKKHTEETKRKISESLKGHKHTEESKQKMGNSHRGKRHTEESKQKMSRNCVGMLGKHHTLKTKRKLSYINRGKKFTKETRQKLSEVKKAGSHPNWQGGISFEPYSLEFNNQLKEQIRERDDYICQFCGGEENGRRHTVHHINYDKKDCRPVNLIAICTGCNGRANYNRDSWQMFFEILQEIRWV